LIARAVGGFDARDLDAAGVEVVVGPRRADRRAACGARGSRRRVVARYLYEIVAATRTSPDVALGASPRARRAGRRVAGCRVSRRSRVRDAGRREGRRGAGARAPPDRAAEAELDGTSADDVVAHVLASVAAPET